MGPLTSSRTTVVKALGVKGSLMIRREIFVPWARMREEQSRARARASMSVISVDEAEGVVGLRWMDVRIDWSCSRSVDAVVMRVSRALRASSSVGAMMIVFVGNK